MSPLSVIFCLLLLMGLLLIWSYILRSVWSRPSRASRLMKFSVSLSTTIFLDAHPNEALNKEIGELLTHQIQTAGIGK